MKPPSRASSGGVSARLRSNCPASACNGTSRPAIPPSAGSPAIISRSRPACSSPAPTARRSRGPPRSSANRPSARPRSGQRRSAVRASSQRSGATMNASTSSSRRADRVGHGQRCRQPFGQQPPTGIGHGPVDRRQQRALARCCQAAVQFQIPPRRRVDQHHAVGLDPARPIEARQQPLLGQLEIADERTGGGEFRPAERAEALQRRDLERRAQPPLGGDAVEARVGQRRDRTGGLAP